MRYVFLSHPHRSGMPVYGDKADLRLQQVNAISAGASSNSWQLTTQTHWGTHMDAPNHFFEHGRKLLDYPAEFFVFNQPAVVEVQLDEGELLRWDAIEAHVGPEADLILFRSGWWKQRGAPAYQHDNPGLHEEIGHRLRQERTTVRAVGMDWISTSSRHHREMGRAAHRAFLDPAGPNEPVLLLEDVDLSAELTNLAQVVVAPWRVEGVDGGPCTVLGMLG